MKIKLSVSKERYQEVEAALTKCGIEIDDNAEFVISERNRYLNSLFVKDPKTNERVFLSTDEIISIESFGHSVEAHTEEKVYHVSERLYKLANQLDPAEFFRISNSVIIARNKIKVISPTLFMKFILTMVDGRKVDVTRSYYYIFKDYLGI